jgi:hypothetical protein
MALAANKRELAKPLAGLVFVVFWAVAIVIWVITASGTITNDPTRGFLIDIGIVLASVGFSAPFLATVASLRTALLFAVIGVIIFGIAEYTGTTVVIYTLRMGIPFLALLTPVAKIANGFHVFS